MLFKGPVEDGLYPLRLNSTPSPVEFLATKVSGTLWHARLGHPSTRILKMLFPSLHVLNKDVTFCESCILGKSTKLPFTSRTLYAPSILHTLHTDVWGPAPISSFDGFRFYLVIVDEYSRYIWKFPLARKSDVLHIFPKFLTMIENQFQIHVKIIQSDGGGEFVNNSKKNYFVSKGIIHRLSCPNTPEQNGFAE